MYLNRKIYFLRAHPERGTRDPTNERDHEILHYESNPKRINALEEIEIMKAITSDHMLSSTQNNNSLYQMVLLLSLQDQTSTSTDTC